MTPKPLLDLKDACLELLDTSRAVDGEAVTQMAGFLTKVNSILRIALHIEVDEEIFEVLENITLGLSSEYASALHLTRPEMDKAAKLADLLHERIVACERALIQRGS